ncbi:Cell wall-associated hydrolase, NlpC family [Nocardioides scoriae]|uniref:Cell wall-associated hydrolase, NlpC family n=1 Tax=Nocardioides scoriae TaxID=642780 RepID=A0A1H1MJB8_9ACTN|nr:C40 family peptidase [Nocardioides scoriae]SDR86944.1 Cell wall-associated hydrolase, NlpC family [Nocardioides scoriae]
MLDGWKDHHARATACVALTLGLTGLGLVSAGPAAASPESDLQQAAEAAQAKADSLAPQAETTARQHDRATRTLTSVRTRLDRLDARLDRERTLVETLRSQMAAEVVATHDTSGGTGAPAAEPRLSTGSETLLTNVTVVTEDTDGASQRLAEAGEAVQQLGERRVDLRQGLSRARDAEQRLQQRASRSSAALDRAQGRAAGLQARLDEIAAEKQAEKEAAQARQASGSVVDYAMAQVGKSYVWGAAGPSSFDCSGLTMAAWAQRGVSLPHSSSAQYSSGQRISESELQPGDLVFYYSPISHVGIYVGNGQIVNALNPSSGVQVSGLHDMPYVGAVRPG